MQSFSLLSDESRQKIQLAQAHYTARKLGVWLQFLGAAMVFGGTLLVFTIIALPLAVVLIWLGVLLFQAGIQAGSGEDTIDAIAGLLGKLKQFFVGVTALLTLVAAFIVLGFVYAGDVVRSYISLIAG